MITRLLLICILGVFMIGCVEQESDYEIPFEGSRLAVLALLEHDQIAKIRLHRTFDPARPTAAISVPDARVLLWEGDLVIAELEYLSTDDEYQRGSLYRSVLPVQFLSGQDYFLSAEAPGLPKLESEAVQMSELIKLDSISSPVLSYIAGIPFFAQTQMQLSRLFPADGYLFEFIADYRDTTGQLADMIGVSTFLHYSPPFDTERTPSTMVQLSLTLPLVKSDPGSAIAFFARDTALVSIRHFSPVYATYFEQKIADGGGFEAELGGFFSTFYRYPNNFSGGYGIFGISNSFIVSINL